MSCGYTRDKRIFFFPWKGRTVRRQSFLPTMRSYPVQQSERITVGFFIYFLFCSISFIPCMRDAFFTGHRGRKRRSVRAWAEIPFILFFFALFYVCGDYMYNFRHQCEL